MAVSVQLLQLMYTEKKSNFDNCSWDNIFFHKWHVLIFQETVSVMVYVSLTQSHWRHLLSRKSNERKLVSEVLTLGAMYLGNSVSIVRICCLSVAYVIILNSLNHEKNVRTVANTKGWAETFLQQYCIFDQSGDSPLSALLFCQFAGFLYLLSLFWFAVVEWIPDWKWRRSFSQGNGTFAYGR